MKVEIYIEHTFKSPRRTQGIYGYILVYKASDGKEATKTVIKELSATPHEADLTAAVEALGKLNRPCEVEIIAGSRYLRETVEAGWLDRWAGNGWKNAKGDPIANLELWQQYEELMRLHQITYTPDGSFRRWLQAEVEKVKQEKKKERGK